MKPARESIERAIYAAFGCTDLYRMKQWPAAAKQITEFVVSELERDGFKIVKSTDTGSMT